MGDACEFGLGGEMKNSITRRKLELGILASKRFVPKDSFHFTTTDHAFRLANVDRIEVYHRSWT